MVSIDTLRQKYEDLRSRQHGEYWSPSIGNNNIRIMPPKDPDNPIFYAEVDVHWNVGPNNKRVNCIKASAGVCPVCEVVEKLRNSKDPIDQALVNDMRSQTRAMMNIVDLGSPEKGVQIYECGSRVLQDVLGFFVDPDWGDLTDPERGYNVIIERQGSRQNDTRYTVRARKSATPIDKEEWLEQLNDLNRIAKGGTYDQVKAILTGEPVDSEKEAPIDYGTSTTEVSRPAAKSRGKKDVEEPPFDTEGDPDDASIEELEKKLMAARIRKGN